MMYPCPGGGGDPYSVNITRSLGDREGIDLYNSLSQEEKTQIGEKESKHATAKSEISPKFA
jgi:hypothetical protein